MASSDVLLDPSFTVPSPPLAATGVAWLRSHVVRFSEGSRHRRRRALVESLLSDIAPEDLHRAGDHVATLAEVLGMPRSVAADVRVVAECYQPHLPIEPTADEAVRRLVDVCGGTWDEATANRIGLLVQACAATAAAIAGERPPVGSTRRVDSSGHEVTVDLSDHPFGRGHHACPGRALADALVAGATRFHRLHAGPEPLLLPNAWDVASAEAFVAAGYRAVGTTSLGVAAAHGIVDGVGATAAPTMRLAAALSRLPVPVTIDIESGWGLPLDELAMELADMGIAGVNVEDGRGTWLVDPDHQATAIRALKAGAPNLFVNARIDTFWIGRDRDGTIDRAVRYVAAGADGVFAPGLLDEQELAKLVRAIDPTPVNVLAGPDPIRLRELGVRRISTGSLPYRAALAAARLAAEACLTGGVVLPESVSYEETNELAGVHGRRYRPDGGRHEQLAAGTIDASAASPRSGGHRQPRRAARASTNGPGSSSTASP